MPEVPLEAVPEVPVAHGERRPQNEKELQCYFIRRMEKYYLRAAAG